jgi:molybdopterin-guanine dinucleotide biosynthesis protein A
MIDIPGMMLVGAGARNAGKTEFACSLIGKFCSDRNITGIKVTTINELDSGCARGGEGCGVCARLTGNFCITEETNSTSNKDTCRMLAAGAKKVFWLRVLKKHLTEGITALLKVIGNEQILICESNSLRNVVKPGLFFMVQNGKAARWKQSAEEVVGYADEIVLSDGNQFSIDIDSITLVNGKWTMKMDATAIIMAGGKSRRMGQDKSMLMVNGEPVIKHIFEQLRPHFSQILVSSDDVLRYSFLGVQIVQDEDTGKGPLMGIASTLRASANQINFVIACDIPEVDLHFVRQMVRESNGFDAVVPQSGPSQYEPLFAVYKKSTLPAIDHAMASGNYRITEALGDCKVNYIDLANSQQLKNLNTMKDYQRFIMEKSDVAI